LKENLPQFFYCLRQNRGGEKTTETTYFKTEFFEERIESN